MGIKIDLGLKQKRQDMEKDHGDPIVALEALLNVKNELKTYELEYDALNAAIESLQKGIEFSRVVAEKSNDKSLHIAAGKEALASSLRIIGQENIVKDVTAGAESYEAGLEANKNILDKMIEKSKELAKKTREKTALLLKKTSIFIKDTIGGGTEAAKKIKFLLSEAKKEKRVNLKTDRFNDKTAVKLINTIKLLAYLKGNKGVAAKDLEKLVEELSKRILEMSNIKEIIQPISTFKDKAEKLISSISDDITITDIVKILNLKENVMVPLEENKVEIVDKVDGDLEKYIKNVQPTDIKSGKCKIIYYNGDSIVLYYIYVKNSYVIRALKDNGLKGLEAVKTVKDFLNNLYYLTYPFHPKLEFVEAYANKLKPVPYKNVAAIADKLEKIANKVPTAIKDIEKKYNSSMESIGDAVIDIRDRLNNKIKSGEGLSELEIETYELLRLYHGFISFDIARRLDAEIDVFRDAIKPKWTKIIEESIKLYEK